LKGLFLKKGGGIVRALVFNGARQITVQEIEKPKLAGDQVLIKIALCGICGSDIHAWEAADDLKGLITGHEFSGMVEDPGPLAGSLKKGDRVTGLPMNYCGKCSACKKGLVNMCEIGPANIMGLGFPGAYAEYTALRADMIKRIPDGMGDNEAAMIEPAAVGFRAISLAEINPGDKVLITGGGVIGLLCAAWARISGASFVALTEVNKFRMGNAKKMGDVDEVFDAKDEQLIPNLMQASQGGFDKAIECTGLGTGIDAAVSVMKSGAKIVLVGLSFVPVTFNTFAASMKELKLVTSFGYTDEDFSKTLELIAKKFIKAERFITDTVGYEGVQAAFERLKSPDCADIKILIDSGK